MRDRFGSQVASFNMAIALSRKYSFPKGDRFSRKSILVLDSDRLYIQVLTLAQEKNWQHNRWRLVSAIALMREIYNIGAIAFFLNSMFYECDRFLL